MSDYESPLEHYSSPNGCADDCPACADERKHEQGACILTGAPGENPDDCTTHEHESEETRYCCIPLCEWEAVTQRGERHLCAQCAQAFDAGVEYAERPDDCSEHIAPLLREMGDILIARGHHAGEVRAKLAGGDFDEDNFWEQHAGPAIDGLARHLGLEPFPKEVA